jgi:hypothetical protein
MEKNDDGSDVTGGVMPIVLASGVQTGSSGKTDRKHTGLCAIACTGSFIPSNNIADSRREGEMEANCCPCLLKPLTKQPGLINTYAVTQVYFGIQLRPGGSRLSFCGYTFKVVLFPKQHSKSCAPLHPRLHLHENISLATTGYPIECFVPFASPGFFIVCHTASSSAHLALSP